jgi:hypothetical protein
MTGYTTQDGALAAVQAPADLVYGPYLQVIPTNPFIPIAANAAVITEVNTGTTAPGDDSSGWWFNTVTGVFKANDNETGHTNL